MKTPERSYHYPPPALFTLSDRSIGSCSQERNPAEEGHNRTVSTAAESLFQICTFAPSILVPFAMPPRNVQALGQIIDSHLII